MSDLPPGWEWTTLGEIADTTLGKMLDRGRPEGHVEVPYLRNVNVQWGHIDISDVLTMEIAPEDLEFFSLAAGDLLICEGGEIGRAAVWRGSDSYMAFQKALHRVRPHVGIDGNFILYLLHWMASTGTLADHATGSTIKHLPQKNLRGLPLTLPPLAEQRKIVELLDQHLGAINRGGELVELCRARGTAMRSKSVVGVLHAHGSPRPLAPPPAPSFTTDGDLPALPESWSWKRLQDVADVVGGITKDSSKQSDPDMPLVPYLRVANVQRGHLDLSTVAQIRATPRQAEKLQLLPGDVLLNEGGDRDKLGRGWVWEGQIADCIHQNHVFRARVKDDEIHPKLLAWHANSFGRWFERNGKQSVNLASISLTTIKQLPVPVPPREIQNQLVAAIDDQLAAAARLDSQLTDVTTRSRRLRSAVLSEALAGRLPTGDPSDEPASVLLDRIHSERVSVVPAGSRRHRS